MAGQQRDRKAAALVQHHNGGVGGLAAAVGRDGPHRNADSPHKNQARHFVQTAQPSRLARVTPSSPQRATATGLGRRQPPGQRQPLAGKGKIRAGHCGVSPAELGGKSGVVKLAAIVLRGQEVPHDDERGFGNAGLAGALRPSVPTVQCTIFCSGQVAL